MLVSNCQSLSDYYRCTYFEWRKAYRLSDCCMHELVSAMRAELEGRQLDREEVLELRKLIMMIEAELDIAQVLNAERVA